jgi:hypothetical protein
MIYNILLHIYVYVYFYVYVYVYVCVGIAQNGIGISEKVWMTYDRISLQPGSYDGEPDVFVLRDILQYSTTRAEAEAYMKSVNRTWFSLHILYIYLYIYIYIYINVFKCCFCCVCVCVYKGYLCWRG